MPEHIKLVNKEPALVGPNNLGLALGLLESRGDKFMLIMDVTNGRVHVVEVFTATALGKYIAGHREIEDDKLWAILVQACNSYGLTSAQHIAYCILATHVDTEATRAIIKAAELEKRAKKK
jgi:hypothetical protein